MLKNYFDEWNRKEEIPEKTINRFREKFKSIGIKTDFSEESSHNGLWYSVTLTDVDNNKISTRGKGVSQNYSKASACGEFSERLQGEWLYRVPDENPYYIQNDEISDETREYLEKAFGKYGFLKINSKQSVYIEMNSKKLVDIPDDLVSVYSGTNGLAAGNTKTEAFVQGTCEIFERYVTKMIYSGKYSGKDFPTLKRSVYENLNSYKMIQEIENNGFFCYVKDCSLCGVYPVIGVLVMDSSKIRYCFSLSSDFNIDIALQRCITEIFQNFDMGISMKLQMCNKYECKDYWDERISDYNGFSKTVFNGTGQLPYWLLDSESYQCDRVFPIGYEKLTNTQCKNRIMEILKGMNKSTYVKDCSFLGIPSLRIVIPGLSDIYWKGQYIDYSFIISENLKLLMKKYKNFNDVKDIYDRLTTIFDLPMYRYECSWKKIYGPYMIVRYNDNEVDIYLYYAALCISLDEYEKAIFYLKKSGEFYSDRKYYQRVYYAGIIVYGIRDGKDNDSIMEVIGDKYNKEEIRTIIEVLKNVSSCFGIIEIPDIENMKLNYITELMKNHKLKMRDKKNYVDDLFG